MIIGAFPIMNIIKLGETPVNLSLADFLVIPLVILFFIHRGRTLLKLPYIYIFAAFLGIYFISAVNAFFNIDIVSAGVLSVATEGAKIVITAIYFYIGYFSFSSPGEFRTVIKIWVVGLWANIILGLTRMFIYMSGVNFSIINITSGHDSRFLGTFTDANQTGTYLSLSFFILVAFISVHKEKPYRIFGIVTMPFVITCIILTQSRGTIAGFSVAIAIFIISYGKRAGIKTIYAIIILLVLFFGFIGLDRLYFNGRIYQQTERRLSGFTDMEGELGVRINLSRASVMMGTDHLLTGVGKGNFKYNSKHYVDMFYDKSNDYVYRQSTTNVPHNTLAGIFAEMGLLGLIIFIWLFAAIALRMAKIRNGINSLLTMAFIAILIQSLSLSLENFRGLWLIAGICLRLQEIKGTVVGNLE
jgi:O-antigen ligase